MEKVKKMKGEWERIRKSKEGEREWGTKWERMKKLTEKEQEHSVFA